MSREARHSIRLNRSNLRQFVFISNKVKAAENLKNMLHSEHLDIFDVYFKPMIRGIPSQHQTKLRKLEPLLLLLARNRELIRTIMEMMNVFIVTTGNEHMSLSTDTYISSTYPNVKQVQLGGSHHRTKDMSKSYRMVIVLLDFVVNVLFHDWDDLAPLVTTQRGLKYDKETQMLNQYLETIMWPQHILDQIQQAE